MSEVTVKDVVENIYTFQDFLLDREKNKPEQRAFDLAEQGSTLIGKSFKKQIYELRGYRFEKLEHLEKAAKNMGLNLEKLKVVCEILPDTGFYGKLLNRFMTEEEYEQRKRWK